MSEQSRQEVSRRRLLCGAAAAGAAGLAGCTAERNTGTGTELTGDIAVAGSSTVFPIAEGVAEMFMAEYGETSVTVQSTGSGGGFTNFFCPGRTDLNNASRPIQPVEEEQCRENGVEWHPITVATDALTVVVNNEADFVDHLTVDELAAIWGQDPVSTWQEVRPEFPDEEISRFGAAETSGTFDYFVEAVLGEEGVHTNDYLATENDNAIVTGVAGDEYAIGYFGFAYYQSNRSRVTALGIDDGDGEPVKPSLETAQSGEYTPLSRPLFTYPAKESLREEHVAEFARFFVEQTANHELIAENIGYVPNSEEAMQEELAALEEFIPDA